MVMDGGKSGVVKEGGKRMEGLVNWNGRLEKIEKQKV